MSKTMDAWDRELATLAGALHPFAQLGYHKKWDGLPDDTPIFTVDAGGPVTVITLGDIRRAREVWQAWRHKDDAEGVTEHARENVGP